MLRSLPVPVRRAATLGAALAALATGTTAFAPTATAVVDPHAPTANCSFAPNNRTLTLVASAVARVDNGHAALTTEVTCYVEYEDSGAEQFRMHREMPGPIVTEASTILIDFKPIRVCWFAAATYSDGHVGRSAEQCTPPRV